MKPIEFSEFDLENGLHCIVHENHRAPIVALDLWYHVGSKNEEPHRTGFAHLFEHLMFQGSANVGKAEHFNYIQKAGGTLNGSTSQDRTNYFETLPAHQLELGFWLESDRMMSLNVNQENFENQRQVVMEERRQRYDNQPYGTAFEELHRRAFIHHPYRWVPIGSMAHLEEATAADAQAFFKKFYTPNNAVLVVAGDTTVDRVKALAAKYFGDIPAGESFDRPTSDDAPLSAEVREVIYDTVQLPALFAAYRIPAATTDDGEVFNAIGRLLTGGRSSRLYKRLVYEENLAQSVSASPSGTEHPGLFYVRAIAMQGVPLEKIDAAITEEFRKLAAGDLTEAELQKAKNSNEVSLLYNLSTMVGVADSLAQYHTFYGDAGAVNTDIERHSRITLDDVQRVAKRYLDTDKRVVLHWLPKDGEN